MLLCAQQPSSRSWDTHFSTLHLQPQSPRQWPTRNPDNASSAQPADHHLPPSHPGSYGRGNTRHCQGCLEWDSRRGRLAQAVQHQHVKHPYRLFISTYLFCRQKGMRPFQDLGAFLAGAGASTLGACFRGLEGRNASIVGDVLLSDFGDSHDGRTTPVAQSG